MTVTSSKIATLPRPARVVAPVQSIPAERVEAARRQEEAVSRAAFVDAMELAMTGVVLLGALLFAAGLVRYGAPAGMLRDDAAGVLYALAALGGAGLGIFTLRAIGRRLVFLARRRG